MRRALPILLAAGATALASASWPAPRSSSATTYPLRLQAPDSIVLERTLCFGSCPAYRLRINSAGRVRFESRNPGDEGRVVLDTIPASRFADLIAEIEKLGFDTFPERTEQDRRYCRYQYTDHPAVIVTVVRGSNVKRVQDYTGCYNRGDSPLLRLRRFQALVDSVAGSSRWVRPARR